ncbi:electron transporter RnfE [Arcobacter sp. F155]|uniref:SHOCT domain-containing protein n=1 Tax=Arcobacter sp. F155 TaxID=2044512 RepID=UPI00100A6485|nr:SHOCT domain-containing protein [Arcobacter sp. F155]RXJ76967.1 electron transporter RnfE [Arcobacter sp. F155]
MFDYMHMNMTMFHGFWMFIFWLFIFYVLISLLKKDKKDKDSAIDILKKRLAKGEITKEEYEEIKKTLE